MKLSDIFFETNCTVGKSIPAVIVGDKLKDNEISFKNKTDIEICYPAGFEADNTTPHFEYEIISKSRLQSIINNNSKTNFIWFGRSYIDGILQESITLPITTTGTHFYMQSYAPGDLSSIWYDTTTNTIKIYVNEKINNWCTTYKNTSDKIIYNKIGLVVAAVDYDFKNNSPVTYCNNNILAVGTNFIYAKKGARVLIPDGKRDNKPVNKELILTKPVFCQLPDNMQTDIEYQLTLSEDKLSIETLMYDSVSNYNKKRGIVADRCIIGTVKRVYKEDDCINVIKLNSSKINTNLHMGTFLETLYEKTDCYIKANTANIQLIDDEEQILLTSNSVGHLLSCIENNDGTNKDHYIYTETPTYGIALEQLTKKD